MQNLLMQKESYHIELPPKTGMSDVHRELLTVQFNLKDTV